MQHDPFPYHCGKAEETRLNAIRREFALFTSVVAIPTEPPERFKPSSSRQKREVSKPYSRSVSQAATMLLPLYDAYPK